MTAEHLMESPLWKKFWFLRPVGPRPGCVNAWQIWDFEDQWYGRSQDGVLIAQAATAEETCRAALDTLNARNGSESGDAVND